MAEEPAFYSPREVQIQRKHDNIKRPESALGYRPPAVGYRRSNGPKAAYALAIRPDNSGGADQKGYPDEQPLRIRQNCDRQ